MEHTQVAVVGGGVAGTAAARTAAELGLDVVLIDEHPLEADSMAMDIPQFFGQRALGTTSDRGLMMDRVISANAGLQSAAEAGAKVLPGVVVWDSSANNTLTLADDDRTWRLRYERAIFASGARDLCLPFRGWDKAGVMGAAAALTLINRYQAFAARRIVVLGGGGLAQTLVASAQRAGVEVAGVIEIRRTPDEFGQTPLFPNHGVLEAVGGEQVEGLAIAELDESGVPSATTRTEIECDAVCFAIGLVSNVDVMYWTGIEFQFLPGEGELAPRVDGEMRTTRPQMFAAGDCAGVTGESFTNPETAEAQGRAAATAAARDLGVEVDAAQCANAPRLSNGDGVEGRRAWVRALCSDGDDVPVCLCEDVTRSDIVKAVHEGPKTPDHVKRLTRGGMGHCQGRRCREGIQALVSELTGAPLGHVAPASYRPPFRPVSLEVVRNRDLTQEEQDFVKVRWHRRKPTSGGRSVEAS